MDLGSLIAVIGSVDAGSLVAPLEVLTKLIDTIFPAVAVFFDLIASGSAASAGSIQTAIGSVGGM